MKFAHKSVLCNTEDLVRVSREVEIEWLTALLLRLKVDADKLERIKTDPNYGNIAWRDYIAIDKGLNIIRHSDGSIVVEKHFDGRPKVMLGKWEKPETVRVKDGSKYHIELRLKYSQLV